MDNVRLCAIDEASSLLIATFETAARVVGSASNEAFASLHDFFLCFRTTPMTPTTFWLPVTSFISATTTNRERRLQA